MKSVFCLFIVTALTGAVWTTNQTNTASASSEKEATQKLGVFIGKWESTGEFFETKLSRAHKTSSNIECRWSPQGNFLVCEQSITDGSEKRIQLSIYSYNSKDGNYTISSMSGPGQQPFNGTVIIKGNLWTYPGGFEKDGKRIEIRTTNDFSVANTEVFKTEFSDDGGAHWTTMLQGTAHKVGA
ncbi:MAG TPA: hypothetical protein VG759_13215 [Candidatus Angelobacter sp.]|jgi:hypothetical protein|nr:hypothetical protein [Candidatus Angelobacter sp.]